MPVRLTLPENAGRLLQHPGRSITLRIHPEHLGPARLHLVMRREVLTARVTVQTEQARGVVEHSLQQLHQQLDKAGIKVGQVEVNVAGDSAHHDLPKRQLAWQQPTALKSRAATSDEPLIAGHPAVTTHRSTPGYIHSNGINVLA